MRGVGRAESAIIRLEALRPSEIDAIVTLPDGRWGAVEVKLGGARMLVGVESLRGVIDQIDTDAVGEPAFRLVVTGTGPILTADDGT